MPTKQLRIAITPNPKLRASLEELAEVMEKPVATVVVDLLNEMQPQLQDLAKLVRYAKAGKKSAVKRTLSHMVGDQLAQVMLQHQAELKEVQK